MATPLHLIIVTCSYSLCLWELLQLHSRMHDKCSVHNSWLFVWSWKKECTANSSLTANHKIKVYCNFFQLCSRSFTYLTQPVISYEYTSNDNLSLVTLHTSISIFSIISNPILLSWAWQKWWQTCGTTMIMHWELFIPACKKISTTNFSVFCPGNSNALLPTQFYTDNPRQRQQYRCTTHQYLLSTLQYILSG